MLFLAGLQANSSTTTGVDVYCSNKPKSSLLHHIILSTENNTIDSFIAKTPKDYDSQRRRRSMKYNDTESS